MEQNKRSDNKQGVENDLRIRMDRRTKAVHDLVMKLFLGAKDGSGSPEGR